MSNYPSRIDSDAELPGVIDGATELSAEAIEAQRLAILAVERTLGTDPQGSVSTLADRLDESLNPDGTIKAAALSAAGLVGLPIENSDVGATAGIEESKLALDVPTQSLQNQVTSNDVDIYALQVAATNYASSYASHVAGTSDQHAAAKIVVSPAVSGGSNVQTALTAVQAEVAAHLADTTGAHAASAISYSPPVGTDFVAANVATALDLIVTGSTSATREHSRAGHTNGISLDGYANSQLGGAGGVLATTLYTPLGGIKVIKIGSLGRPQIRTLGASPELLTASAANIDITYSDGYSVVLLAITGLNSVPYPAGTENRIRGVVSSINSQLAAVRAPIFAYEDRGELLFQHAFADGSFYFTSPANSAAQALGLIDVLGLAAINSTNSAVTNGLPRFDYPTVQTGSGVFASPSTTLTVDASTVVGSLVYISDHPTASGVYQVTSLTGASATLNASIPAGVYSYLIQSDSLAIGGVSVGRTYDILVDEDLLPSKTLRLQTTTAQISGVVVSSCRLAAGAYSLALTASSGTRYLSISDGSNSGPTASFTNGFMGAVTVKGPGSSGNVTVDVRAASISAPATDQFTVYAEATPSLQLVSSFWTTGSVTEYPFDLRQFGLTGEGALSSQEVQRISQASPGLLFGCTVGSTASTAIIGSGRALVSGREHILDRVELDFSAKIGTYNIWIDSVGTIRSSVNSAPNQLADIFNRGEIPIAQVIANSNVTSIYDCGLFSARREAGVLTISSSVEADCRNLAGGLLLASSVAIRSVRILTAESTALTLSISNTRLVGQDALTFGTLSISNVDIFCENLTATTLSLSLGSDVECKDLTVGTLTVDSSKLKFETLSTSTAFTMTGQAPAAIGFGNAYASIVGSIEFTDSTDAILSDISATYSSTSSPYVLFSSTNVRPNIFNFTATAASPISAADAASTALHFGFSNTGDLSGFFGSQLTISERSALFANAAAATCEATSLDRVVLSHSGGLLRNIATGSISGFKASNVYATEQAGSFIALPGACSGLIVDGLEIASHMTSSTFKLLDASVASEKVILRDLFLHDVTTTADLVAATSTDLFIDGGLLDTVSAGYLFAPTTSTFVVDGVTGLAINAKLLLGEQLKLLDCNLTFSSITGSPVAAVTSGWTQHRIIVDGCDLTMPTTTKLTAREFIVRDSRLSVGSYEFTAPSTGTTGYILEESTLIASSTGASIGFNFSGLSNAVNTVAFPAIVRSNIMSGSPSQSLISVDPGVGTYAAWIFESNHVSLTAAASGDAILQVGTTSTVSNNYIVKNNYFFAGTGGPVSRALFLLDDNIKVEGNFIEASNVSGFVFGSVASGGQVGVSVLRNTVVAATGLVADATNLNLANNRVADNSGLPSTYSFSCLGMETYPDWDIISDEVTSTTTAILYVPLSLPTGRMTSCSIDIYAPGAIASVSCDLFAISGVGAITSYGSASNALGASAETLVILPVLFVKADEPLFLKVNADGAGNILGAIKVVIEL
jgi:hypothetical protein